MALLTLAAMLAVLGASGQGDGSQPSRRVSTFSIVTRDPSNGDLRVAVQSKFRNVRVRPKKGPMP